MQRREQLLHARADVLRRHLAQQQRREVEVLIGERPPLDALDRELRVAERARHVGDALDRPADRGPRLAEVRERALDERDAARAGPRTTCGTSAAVTADALDRVQAL